VEDGKPANPQDDKNNRKNQKHGNLLSRPGSTENVAYKQ